MKVKYRVKRTETRKAEFGCFAGCCWRFAAGAQGQI